MSAFRNLFEFEIVEYVASNCCNVIIGDYGFVILVIDVTE